KALGSLERAVRAAKAAEHPAIEPLLAVDGSLVAQAAVDRVRIELRRLVLGIVEKLGAGRARHTRLIPSATSDSQRRPSTIPTLAVSVNRMAPCARRPTCPACHGLRTRRESDMQSTG